MTGARIGGTADRTRFVVDLSAKTDFSVVATHNPDRVIIELSDVSFDLPTGAGRKPRGLIREFRYGALEIGKARIVIDTDGPVRVDQPFLLPAEGKQPARLVIDMLRADAPAVQVAAATFDEPVPTSQPEVLQQPAPAAERKVIVIDPGHGGIDPGALSPGGLTEKEVVLAFSLVLRDQLLATGLYDVHMTRSDDTFVKLKDRVSIARAKKADLFIAIHADILRGRTVRGTTFYTLSEKASDAEAEALAQKENRSDIIAGFDLASEDAEVTDFLIELTQRESKNLSFVFAKKAAQALQGVTLLTGKPVRSAGFVVLKAPDVPSVLVELGYLSSKQDEKLLNSNAWRHKVAAAMAKALAQYFAVEVAQNEDADAPAAP